MKSDTKFRKKTTIYTMYDQFANIFIKQDDEKCTALLQYPKRAI